MVACSLAACTSDHSTSADTTTFSTATTIVTTTTTTTPTTTTTTTLAIEPTTIAASTTDAPSTTLDLVVLRSFPFEDPAATSWGETHSGYPAADIFHRDGCGTGVLAPIDGLVLDLRRDDPWDAAVDDPTTRGGLYLLLLGDDGVRYYMAHFQRIADELTVGSRVAAHQYVGDMGDTGRAGACHLHLGLSPPCDTFEWWVRRGVVWPAPYLADWAAGGTASPADEVQQWMQAHPDACHNQGQAT